MKQFRNFPTAHCHIQSLDSASTPEAFAEREVQLGTGVITCTDHGSLSACRKVYKLAKENDLTPIVGLEAYFRDDDCPIFRGAGIQKSHPKDKQGNELTNQPKSYAEYFKYGHVTIHCLDYPAYEVLVRRLSMAAERAEKHGSEYKPLFDWVAMEEICAQNVTVTSGCLIGMVQRHLMLNNDPEMALKYYERLRSLCRPGNFYVEIFPHVCDRNWEQAVYVTLEGGERLRFYDKKRLRTNAGEVVAAKLAKDWEKEDRGGHEQLLAVKHYHTWQEREPARIAAVEHREGFLLNECRPWAQDGDLQLGCNQFVSYLAKTHGDPIIIGDDSHFVSPQEKTVQDVRLMATSGGQWRFATSYHRQDSAEAYSYFGTRMGMTPAEYEGIVDGCYAWADRFKGFKFENRPELPTKFYPDRTLEHTMALIEKQGRMDWSNQAKVDRLTYEIKLLYENGRIDLLPYFFIGAEVADLYERAGELTGPGRGSAAGLLLADLLGITHADPLDFDLSVDRFMTMDRVLSGKFPDIDMDFPHRDLIVGEDGAGGWLKERFGRCAAQVSTDHTLRLKQSVLDVARVRCGQVPPEVARLAHAFEVPPQGLDDHAFIFGYKEAGNWVEGSIKTDPALQEYVAKYPGDWELVQKSLGLTRQKSRHASAFVITNRPVDEFIPTVLLNGVRCTQDTAEAVEAAGAIKFDFLVINSLRDIGHAIKLIQDRSGVDVPKNVHLEGRRVPSIRVVPHNGELFDVWRLWASPWAQEPFADVAEGKTETVFQYNRPGAVKWLAHFNHLKPDGRKAIDSIEAMAAFTALDRPGPLNAYVSGLDGGRHNMLVEYARRVRGEVPVRAMPEWEALFPKTHGICVYQESLQYAYQQLMGCPGAEAEAFRRDVAKKEKDKILKVWPHFEEKVGAKYGKEKAQQLWDLIGTWSEYGFNKSHAVCYAIIGYACAYLKHWFPLEWWTAVLSNAEKNEVNEEFWPHCGRMVDLPDVNASGKGYIISRNAAAREDRIRAPVDLLLGIGDGAHEQIVAGQPYSSLWDFCTKIFRYKKDHATEVEKVNEETGQVEKKVKLATSAVNRKVAYTLIVTGAMDSLYADRGMSTLDKLQEYEKALAAAEDAVLPRVTKKRGLPCKPRKVEPVDPMYVNLSNLVRYQMRKAILPVYSEPLLPLLLERGVEGLSEQAGGRPLFRSNGDDYRVVGAAALEHLEQLSPFPQGGVRFAVAAYVASVKEFEYQREDQVYHACKMVLEVDGVGREYVRWPARGQDRPPRHFTEALKGAVLLATMNKYSEKKSPSIEDVHIVQAPLDFTAPPERTQE